MSSPLFADFGLCASFLGSGARVRFPNDGEPYWASWSEEAQEGIGRKEAGFARFGQGCHLSSSAI
jgi:hypothetical protein